MAGAKDEFTAEALDFLEQAKEAQLNENAEWCTAMAQVYATLAVAYTNEEE